MASRATGIDVGLRSAVFLTGKVAGNSFAVDRYAFEELSVEGVEGAWAALEPGVPAKDAVVGVTGREVNLRYSRVPRLPDWQLRRLMSFEVESLGDSSESRVAADFNVLPALPELEGEDLVLLAVAREELLETHERGLAECKGSLRHFMPNSIGLYNAWLRFGVVMDDTVLIANIGQENVDAVLVRGADLLFARNLSGGGALFDAAIADRFGVDVAQAERIKRANVDLTPGSSFVDGSAERATRAASAPAGQLLSLLQSTVMFAKAQVKLSSLKLDRVFLCGGGARLRGLPEYLQAALGVPVELFDAFQVVDTSKLPPDRAALLDEHGLESVVALGLATAGSDPRRLRHRDPAREDGRPPGVPGRQAVPDRLCGAGPGLPRLEPPPAFGRARCPAVERLERGTSAAPGGVRQRRGQGAARGERAAGRGGARAPASARLG